MQKVIEAAKALAEAIKQTEAYTTYMSLDEMIQGQEALKTQVELFQKNQFELQRDHMAGVKLEDERVKAIQTQFDDLVKEPKVAQYFQMEMQINQMMSEVTRILGEAMDFRKKKEA